MAPQTVVRRENEGAGEILRTSVDVDVLPERTIYPSGRAPLIGAKNKLF
jgi:hypothetical protein